MPVSVSIPSGKLYAFSPSMMTISGLTANDKVVISANGYSFTRFALGTTMNVPLSKILKSCFVNVDVNDVSPVAAGNTNAGSKLISASTIITITIYRNDILQQTLSPSIIALFGALQIGEIEPLTYTIYRFGLLPLTITSSEPNSDQVSFNNGELGVIDDIFGYDIFLTDEYTLVTLYDTAILLRNYIIEDVELCGDLIYLRWVDRHCNYRYFAFEKISSDKNETIGETFTKELQNLSATSNNLYKNPSKIISKITNNVEIGSVVATYEQQKFISSLKESVYVCKYLGDNKWMEVNVTVPNIIIDEKWKQNKSIEIEVNLPNNYNPTL